MPNKDFLQELKEHHEQVIRLRQRIEDKSSNIVTTSGTIVTLLLGFGIFLLGSLLPNYNLSVLAIAALIVGFVLGLLSMIYGIGVAYSRTKYRFAIAHGIFFNEDGTLKQDTISQFREATEDTFSSLMISEYLTSIKENVTLNKDAAQKLERAQLSLLFTIVMIGILVGVLIDASFHNMLNFQLSLGNSGS